MCTETSYWKLLHYSEAYLAHIVILLIPLQNSFWWLHIISRTCPASFCELLTSSIFLKCSQLEQWKMIYLIWEIWLTEENQNPCLSQCENSACLSSTVWIRRQVMEDWQVTLSYEINKKLQFERLRTRRKSLFFLLHMICGTPRAAGWKPQCHSWNRKVMMTPAAEKALI